MIFLDLPQRTIWYPLHVRRNVQCRPCMCHHMPSPPLMSVTKNYFSITSNDINNDTTASNSAPTSVIAINNSAATPPSFSRPLFCATHVAHPSIVHLLIALPTMACTKMVQPGAASDGATFNGTTFDSTTFDGTTYNDTDYHGSAYHGAMPPKIAPPKMAQPKMVLLRWHHVRWHNQQWHSL
mgnify:CR=1 FL=1